MNKCACRFVVKARNTLAPTVREYQRGRIEFCGLHASAREIFDYIKRLANGQTETGGLPFGELQEVLTLITKAEGMV